LPTSFASGRYQVERFLGEGAKKLVYLARDSRLDRDVAIALIKTEGLDAEGLARIRREAQAMGRLGDHPHIVTVYDIGDDRGQPYIVTQYMAGGDVEVLLQQAETHRLPLRDALRIGDHACQALQYAHGRGVIHRDLKPGNVWLDAKGTAKLGDFGLALAMDRSRLTQTGMIVGTVAYMPPEQALGKSPDARSDLYSLGAMLYEMVTGRPPFLGDDAVAIISQHINTPPVAPSWHNAEVPHALEALILRLLAKVPEERPKTAAAVCEALAAISPTATVVAQQAKREETNPLDRLAGGVFVGREREMDDLRAGLEAALSSRGHLLLLVGEPGIGKTRTADELGTYARLRNAQVLWGRCYEGEGAPAYWPWVQIIRSYVHDREPQTLMSDMGSGAPDIAQVVSEVRERLPGLPTPAPLEPEQARFRLFDSITTFLRNAGDRQPLVLLLDDLHWADKPSLLFLQFLARELHGARLLVLGTYRDVELRRQHPLSQTLAELAREGLTQRILLRGLTKRDVSRFIAITAGMEPPDTLVNAVYQETEGNPFFVNEIVRLLVADGRLERPEDVTSWSVTIPQGVREVVGRRLDHLSEECNRVLTIASVIGRAFGFRILEPVSELPGDRLLTVLEEAQAARVITETERLVDQYSFSHALIRETLYEELSTSRRLRLHRRIGEVMETIHRENLEPYLPALAYHFSEAVQGGDVAKAVDYCRRAGDRATALLAYEEAAGHFERALQNLEVQEPRDDASRCEFLILLGEALDKSGERDKAKGSFEQAVGIARRRGVAEEFARAALGVAGLWVPGYEDEAVCDLLQESLDKLGHRDSVLAAAVLPRLALEQYGVGSREQSRALCEQAVAMSRRLGDAASLARALNTGSILRSEAEHGRPDPDGLSEVIKAAEEAGAGDLVMSARTGRIIGFLHVGDIAAVDAELDASNAMAGKLRQPRYLTWIAWFRAMRVLLEGRFEEGEQLALEALATGRRAEGRVAINALGVQLLPIRREQGRLEELLEPTRRAVQRYPRLPAWRAGLALVCVEMNLRTEALSEFEHLARTDFNDIPVNQLWLFTVATLSEVCALLGDTRRAAHLYDLLLPFSRRNVVLGAVAFHGSASRHLGLLATTLSRWEEAESHFRDALDVHTKMGAKPWVARTRYDYAQMLVACAQAHGQPADNDAVLELVNEALETAQALGMSRLVEQTLALKLKLQGLDSSDVKSSIYAVATSVHGRPPDLASHAAPDGTVTLMFSDMQGFTAMTERLGDLKARDVIRDHNRIVREQVFAHSGYEVELQGDGFLLAFGSARNGLRCAIAIQRAFAAYNAKHHDEPIRVRIGLHTGEVLKDADKFFGKTVILAARIAAQAEGGEILASSLLKELTESVGDLHFGNARSVQLKGISGTQRLFEVGWNFAREFRARA
jgi:class 3 adenylate cyclase